MFTASAAPAANAPSSTHTTTTAIDPLTRSCIFLLLFFSSLTYKAQRTLGSSTSLSLLSAYYNHTPRKNSPGGSLGLAAVLKPPTLPSAPEGCFCELAFLRR